MPSTHVKSRRNGGNGARRGLRLAAAGAKIGAVVAEMHFRAYRTSDRSTCLTLFDENCPASFAPNERDDYATFLDAATSHYVVCLQGGTIVGAYGLYPVEDGGSALRWILVSSSLQGAGLGSIVMAHVLSDLRASARFPLHISASHKSAPFFAKFGATEIHTIPDGWGPSMHRVEMRLVR